MRTGVTIGDPAGIGPELILKLAARRDPDTFVVFGDACVLDWTAKALALPAFRGAVIDVGYQVSKPRFGDPDADCARLQYHALQAAIDAAMDGTIAAIVTTPWTKHILSLADLPATGHTEVLGERCGVDKPTMMLCGDKLRVALATVHVPLNQVSALIDSALLEHHLRALVTDLERKFGLTHPRVAVCGLNPHAGEGGLMGHEDDAIIRPLCQKLRTEGLAISGPFPADTLFPRVVRSDSFDAVLAMYHDQGLIPLKLWHFGESANVTLGLPIVRTSVDHGTAYDIAGRGMADVSSLLYAFDLAGQLAATRWSS